MIGKFFEIVIGGALGSHFAAVATMETVIFTGFCILATMFILSAVFPKWAEVLV